MIVASIETNWNGDFKLLDKMIEFYKKVGIDYVKFQSLSQEKLDRHLELEWYQKSSVNKFNISKIHALCLFHKMPFFVTPFYKEAIYFLNKYVPFWKIPYSLKDNREIIYECVGTGKDVFVSTDKIMDYPKSAVNQIYCIPNYPTSYGEINFNMIPKFYGYSNHCLDPLAILKAKRKGAKYIEFHVTADKSIFSIDNKVSFSFGQVQEIMHWIKGGNFD